MITTKYPKQTYINEEMLLEKAVVNLCAEGHYVFASVQVIDAEKDSSFIQRCVDRKILPQPIADELISIIDAYNS